MANLYFNTALSVFKEDDTLQGVVWEVSGNTRVFISDPEDPILCGYGTAGDPEFLIDVMKLGDGYEQVAPSGIRPTKQTYKVVFDRKRQAVAEALTRFFQGTGPGTIYNRHPAEWFYWRVPQGLPKAGDILRVRAENLKITPNEFDSVTVNVDFVESFEP